MVLGYVLEEKLIELVDGQAVWNERKRDSRLFLGFRLEHIDVWCYQWLK